MLANDTIALQRVASADCVRFAGHVIIGTWLSVTVIVNEHVAVFPLASVAVEVAVVVPTGNAVPGFWL